MSKAIIVLLFLVSVVATRHVHHSFPRNYHIIWAVEQSCPPDYYICPKYEFGFFPEQGAWKWNEDAIIGSEAAERFRNHITRMTPQTIRDAFCCLDGDCLSRCGIFKKDPEAERLDQEDIARENREFQEETRKLKMEEARKKELFDN